MSEIKKRCFGKFELETKFVNYDIELIADIFCKMKYVPFRVEHHYMGDYFVFEGWSPLFEEVEFGHIFPKYSLVLTKKSVDSELEVGVEKLG